MATTAENENAMISLVADAGCSILDNTLISTVLSSIQYPVSISWRRKSPLGKQKIGDPKNIILKSRYQASITCEGRNMLNILVVDDESAVSEVLQQILIRLGHCAEIASGGHEGLRMFDSRVYDLVITDILMPGIDGNGVARHIRGSDRPYTPIIGISGTPWLLEGSMFDFVIPKPFNIQALTSAIDSVMGKGSMPRGLSENSRQHPGLHEVLTAPLLAT